MRQLRRSVHVRRPPAEVFDVVGDLGRYPQFFVGIGRWEPVGEVRHDVGDRFAVLLRVGATGAGGTIRVTDYVPGRRIAWEAETGTDHRIEFDLHGDDGGTHAELGLSFALAGGLASRVVERIAEPMVDRNLVATLESLRHLCEWGPAEGLGSWQP